MVRTGSDRVRPRPAWRALWRCKTRKNFNADQGKCTQNTQMVRYGSQTVHHAFDLQARLAEIKQHAELPASRFEMIGALHQMRVIKCLDCLQLNRKHVLDSRSAKYSPTTTSL